VELLFSNFTIENENCPIEEYSLSSDELINATYTNLKPPVITKDGFIITIDTTYARNFDFSILARDIGGIFNQSKFVHIEVFEEPVEIAIGLINSPPFFDKDIPT
jgi:hypothetical protein